MQKTISVSSTKRMEMIDITKDVEAIVSESKINEGICNVFVSHATAAIAINENYDPNVCEDFNQALSKMIPQGKWMHDRVDGNADSHIKAAIVGPSETIPISNGKLILGTWQSIMMCEFDGPRSGRKVVISLVKN